MDKIIIDVQYSEKARTAGIIVEDLLGDEVLETIECTCDIESDYIPGSFYLRELPCIITLLNKVDLAKVDIIVVDGSYTLWNSRPGLGKHLKDYLESIGYPEIEVIGIAKSKIKDASEFATAVYRSENPLWVNGSNEGRDYGKLVLDMSGKYRIPDLIKIVDKLARKEQ